MEKTYYAADNRRFIEAMNRYRIRYQAEGEEVDGEIEIKPSDDLMAFAKALDGVKKSIDKGFEGREGRRDRPLGRGPPAATPQGPPEDQRPFETHGGGRALSRVVFVVEDGEDRFTIS